MLICWPVVAFCDRRSTGNDPTLTSWKSANCWQRRHNSDNKSIALPCTWTWTYAIVQLNSACKCQTCHLHQHLQLWTPNYPKLTPILIHDSEITDVSHFKSLLIDKFAISNFLFYPIRVRGNRATPEDMGRFTPQQGGQTLFGEEETLRKTRLILEERPAPVCQGEGEQDTRGANKHSQVQLQTIISLTTHNYTWSYV